MLNNYTILCDSNIPWHHNRYSKHHLMSRFARHNEVYFINPSVAIDGFIKKKPINLLKLLKKKEKPENEQLTVFTPLSLPFRDRFEFAVNKDPGFITWQIKRLVFKKNRKRLVLFMGNPWNTALLEEFKGCACTVYHCSDNFPAFFSGGFAKRVEEKEKYVIKNVDLVVATSEILYEKCKALNENTVFIKHGVDERFFLKANLKACPDDMNHIKKPRIGYIGSIDKLIDYNLLKHIVSTQKKYNYVFIGTIDDNCRLQFNDILLNENCFYLGKKPWQQLPDYVQNFDVCIIPWITDEFVLSGSPLKLIEYLASGKMTVATKIALDQNIAPGVLFAKNYNEFVDCIDQAIEKSSVKSIAEKISSLVYNWGWQAKTEEYSLAIDNTIQKKNIA